MITLDVPIPSRYTFPIFINHESASFQRLEVFHTSLDQTLRNRFCPHGSVLPLELLLSITFLFQVTIEKGQENGTSFYFIKSALLIYKFHKIKCIYFKFSGHFKFYMPKWILRYVYICISTTTIKILNISIIPKRFPMTQPVNHFTSFF